MYNRLLNQEVEQKTTLAPFNKPEFIENRLQINKPNRLLFQDKDDYESVNPPSIPSQISINPNPHSIYTLSTESTFDPVISHYDDVDKEYEDFFS